MLALLRLAAAHFVGDFVLQPRWLLTRQRAPRWLALHAVIHAALYFAVLAPAPRSLSEAAAAAVILAGVHAAIDFVTVRFSDDGVVAFCVDQAAHLAVIVAVASWLPTAPLPTARIAAALLASPMLYLYVGGYVAIVPAAGHFVQRVSAHFLKRIDRTVVALKPGLPDAGKYIGWLERSLIVTFVLVGHAEVIGFLIGAKAVIRYPEMKSDDREHFADYFLIGTMTSVGLAIAGGLVLLQVARMLEATGAPG